MISKIRPDLQKAKSLSNMAKITLERLSSTDMKKYPSNALCDYYDVVHNLLEAIACKQGVKVRGEGAHKELIDYVAKRYGLEEGTRRFLQQMREYRNRISYEGFVVKENYLSANKEKIESIIETLIVRLSGS